MSKIPHMPPNILPPKVPKLSEEELKNIDFDKIKQNPAMQKYEQRTAERRKWKADEELKQKKQQRSEWWRNNWVAFVAMIFAFISALPYIIQGIDAMLKWLTQWYL